MSFTHRCSLNRAIDAGHRLHGKTVYLPVMGEGGSEVFASIFRRLGLESHVTPPSNRRTLDLGGKATQGDECYPSKVVIGDLLQVAETPGFRPERTVYFLPTSEGPCRFGQYVPYLRKVLRDAGLGEVEIVSPTDTNSYGGLGSIVSVFTRMAWRGIVASDAIHRLLLKTRPYETMPGAADRVYSESLADLCETIESACDNVDCQLRSMAGSLGRARDRFRSVPARYDRTLPRIGVVGEIFCRLNTFSNEDLVRKLESYGAEASLSHVAEWVCYTSVEQERQLRFNGRAFSMEMLGAKVRNHIRRSDEHALLAPLNEALKGYEEPEIDEIIKLAWPYLPASGVVGEMVLSVGLVAWHAKHGTDGVIDISPFGCMNGTVSEAIYPKVSHDYGGIPVRSFYFDGTRSDLGRDLGVYLELARSYSEEKSYPRTYPACFRAPGEQETGAGRSAPRQGSFGPTGHVLHLPGKEVTQG